MSGMVERVARAMCVAKAVDDDQWQLYAKEARAAIEAMREPTEAMEKAGANKWDDDLCTETNALNMWQAMVDEALK